MKRTTAQLSPLSPQEGQQMSDPLYRLFRQRLLALQLQPKQQIIVCLGGGADSQTVLDLTAIFRQEFPHYQYFAIHLDHAFHSNSKEWAAGLVTDCQRRQFPMHCEPLDVALGRRISKEAAGREARYQRLAELGQPNAVFLLGHHRNDQMETFFLQLKRGAGPKGLAAMAMVSRRGKQTWLRPLLDISKAEIYRYAHEHQLFWIEDDTNYDTRIERNFFRHVIIPELEQRWPHFGNALLRSTQLCAETAMLLDELLAQQITPHINEQGHLATNWLLTHSEQLQRAVLRFWLQQQHAPTPSYAQLEQVRQQMLFTTNEARPQVQWGKVLLTRHIGHDKERWVVLHEST